MNNLNRYVVYQPQAVDLGEFYRQNHHRGVGYALSMGIDGETARDIVSDALLTMLERSDRIDGRRNPESLFFNIVKNRCYDHLRHTAYVNRHAREMAFAGTPYSEDADARVRRRELTIAIDVALGRLSKSEREIFVAVRIHKESYREVAARLNLRIRQIDRPLYKASLAINRALERYKVG